MLKVDAAPGCVGALFESLEPRLMLSTVVATAPLPLAAGDSITASASIGTVRKVYTFGSLLVAAADAGVELASIATPLHPAFLSDIATVHAVNAVTVAGSYLYLGESDGTIQIFSLASLTAPTQVGSMNSGHAIHALAYLQNPSGTNPNRLYVAQNGGVQTWDVGIPATPTLLGTFKSADSRYPNIYNMTFVGSGENGWNENAMALTSGNYVYLMNDSDPSNPWVGSAMSFTSPSNIWADGNKLYVTDSKGLHLIDATSFTNMRNSGQVSTNQNISQAQDVIASSGQVAYFTQPGGIIDAVDTGASGGPAIVGTYTDASFAGEGIAAYQSLLYTAWTTTSAGVTTSGYEVITTGIAQDLTVSVTASDYYYAKIGSNFTIHGSVNNLGTLWSVANQGMHVTAYLSTDGTFTSAVYQLTPVQNINTAIAPLASLAQNWSVKAPNNTPEGFYYLIVVLDNTGASNGDTTNDTWVSAAPMVQVMKGNPPITLTLDAASDSGVLGDNITNITPVSFSGTTRAISTVTLKKGNTVLGTTTSAADGSYSFANVVLTAGNNNLNVAVKDRAGNSSNINKTIVLDTAVATTTLKLDSNSDSGTKNDFLTNIASVKLTGTTEKNATVALVVNSVPIATTVANSGGNFTFTAVSLADGPNTVTVQITDVAGNTSSLTKTITLELAATPPTLVLAPLSDTGTPGDNITSLSKVQFTGTAAAGSTVQLKVRRNGTYSNVTNVKATALGTFTFNNISLSVGVNDFTVTITDLAANSASLATGLLVTYIKP